MTFDAVFSSTANRTGTTLEILRQQYEISDNISFSDEILELDQGEWQGRLRAEIYTAKQEAIIRANQWQFRPPGGETQKEVEERMLNFIKNHIIEPYSEGRFLLVGHGAAFKCLLRGILGLSSGMAYRLAVDNASLTKLRYDKQQGWYLDYLNRAIAG